MLHGFDHNGQWEGVTETGGTVSFSVSEHNITAVSVMSSGEGPNCSVSNSFRPIVSIGNNHRFTIRQGGTPSYDFEGELHDEWAEGTLQIFRAGRLCHEERWTARVPFLAPETITITRSRSSITEQNSGRVNVDAEADFPWALNRTVDLAYGGTATKGTDYTFTQVEDVIIEAFDLTGRTTIIATDDSIYEQPNEGVNITVVGVSNGEKATPATLAPIAIVDNDLPPEPEISISRISHDFGAIPVSGGTATVAITIANVGTAPLTLTGSPRVLISGANAADFSVVQQPPPSLAPMTEVSFSVTFDPAAVGARQASLVIANNDSDENPVTVSLTGTGVPLSTITGTSGNDTIHVIRSGSRLLIYENKPPVGEPTFLSALADIGPSLTIDTLGGNDSLAVDTGGEASLGLARLIYNAGEGANTLSLRGGSARIDSAAVGGSLNTTVQVGARVSTNRLAQNELALLDNSHAVLLSGGEASRLTSLTLGTGASLDVTNNALVIDYTGASPVATIRERILAGRGAAGLGASWTGPGITSSVAAQANQTEPESRSVGYAENAQLPLGPYSTFRGQVVDATAVLIAFTRTADATLDGLVNDDDVTVLGAAYAPFAAKAVWALGDFEYNGFIDDDDVTLLGAFYNPAAAPLGSAPAPALSGIHVGVKAMSNHVIDAGLVELLAGSMNNDGEARLAILANQRRLFGRHIQAMDNVWAHWKLSPAERGPRIWRS